MVVHRQRVEAELRGSLRVRNEMVQRVGMAAEVHQREMSSELHGVRPSPPRLRGFAIKVDFLALGAAFGTQNRILDLDAPTAPDELTQRTQLASDCAQPASVST